MKRNILFSMQALVLAALVPLAGCLAEESVEEEDFDDSAEEISSGDAVVANERIGAVDGPAAGSDVPTATGVVLPGQQESEPMPLPWTGSQARGDEDDSQYGPNPPPVEAASKSAGVHDPY